MLLLLLLLLWPLFIASSSSIDFFDSVTYLTHYGYLTVEASEIMNLHANDTRYIAALELYQRTYRLPINGKLNNDTVQLMGELRCGVSDNVLHHTQPHKWINDTLTWKIYHTDPDIINVAEKAFGVWSKHANINFVQAANNSDANIQISFGRANHYHYRLRQYCPTRFEGGELGHAFLPTESQSPVEIHIDHTRQWSYKLEKPTRHDESSLLETLVHEIGHTLGIVHTDNENSVMYPSYRSVMFKTTPYDIPPYDISAIQNIYGKRISKENPPVTPKTAIKETDIATTPPASYPDLCEINNSKLNTFLIVNGQIYIFSGKWVWLKRLDDDSYKSKPVALRDWLSFLPDNFTHISAVYQKPDGNIVFFIGNDVYVVNYPSLHLIQRSSAANPYPITVKLINAAVSTYTGRTLIFHSNNFVTEIDECTNRTVNNGLIEKQFPGIPSTGLQGVFRYTNGMLYFFKDPNFYEFNEFTNKMIRAARFSLNTFDIKCPNIGVLEQIRALLYQIWNYKRLNNT